MITLLLVIIYAAFISLGLPDTLLGTAWPAMYGGLGVPVSSAGFISIIASGGTIISSLFSGRVIHKFGTGKVTVVSVAMTAIALMGYSISPSFIWLCICAIPLGFGAGSIDAALNNFVALHYKAMHMSWLHCFWGIGATIGPIIMSYCLKKNYGWKSGYRTISLIQFFLVIILVLSLPLWKKLENKNKVEEKNKKEASFAIKNLIKIKGIKPVLAGFFCYCAVEATTGLWGSSFLVLFKGIPAQKAATWLSLYYFGITFGRFMSGFLALKVISKNMIRLGQGLIMLGIILLLIPGGDINLCLGLLTIGIGCAPIFPSLIHDTPKNFGKDLSQSVMGIQMASAYIGSTCIPPLFGLIARKIGFWLLPYCLIFFLMLMILMLERLNSLIKPVDTI